MAITDHSDEVEAFMTDEGRAYTARAINGELVFRAIGFSVGRGGYNPLDPVKVLPINPALTALSDQVYPDVTGTASLQAIDEPTPTVRVFNCRLPATIVESNADYGLGEIGIWSEIIHAYDPSEIGTVFLYAVGHFPIRAKTHRDVFLFRTVINY